MKKIDNGKSKFLEELKEYLEYKQITRGIADGFEKWLEEKEKIEDKLLEKGLKK